MPLRTSFRTAVDLEFSSECTLVSAIPSKGRSLRLFFIIESRASRTLRYPQHIAVAFTALATPAVAADIYYVRPTPLGPVFSWIGCNLHPAWMAAHDISDIQLVRKGARRH